MNKKISTPIALIIILICAVLVAGLALHQYFYSQKIELSEIILPKKPQKELVTPEEPTIEISEPIVVPEVEKIIIELSSREIATEDKTADGSVGKEGPCKYRQGEYELRVYDSQGRVTGLINGEIKREIPRAFYLSEYVIEIEEGKRIQIYPQKVTIFEPKDSYVYEIFGLTDGNYNLNLSFSQEGKEVTFSAINIPILPGVTHQYHFNWEALAQGKDGVIIFIDANKDGVFEKTIKSDPTLTCEEFIALIK